MKKTKSIFIILWILAASSCTQQNNNVTKNENNNQNTFNNIDLNSSIKKTNKEELPKVLLKTAHGNLTIILYKDEAPKTVTRIMQLIEEGFYDGLVFHRVIPDFVVQTGDPTGTGYGGSGKKLMGEFNNLNHERGTVAMARAQDPDSADSQFYITLSERPELNQKYTIFGKVVDGLDILDKIVKGDKLISINIID